MGNLSNKCAVILCSIIFTLGAKPAAAETSGYVEEYRQYNEALAAGDLATAAAHARAAWKDAEAALGDDKTTAVLAFNYGQLVLFDDPQAAQEALQRANALQEAGIADLPVAELDAFLAFAKFKSNGERVADANALRDALENVQAPSVRVARMWLELAHFDVNSRRYALAAKTGARAEAVLAAAAPGDYRARAQAIIFQGAAELLPFNRFISSIEKAHYHFDRAQRLFSPQADIETFDPILAKAIAWDQAARAALGSGRPDSHAKRVTEKWPDAPDFIAADVTATECGREWEDRKPPRYPIKAADKNYIGAVLIGYHLTEDGAVSGARILAEVPGNVFGEQALQSMAKWRHKVPMDPRPECRTNLLTYFTFQID